MVANLLHRRQHTSIEFSCYQYLKDVQHNFPLKKKKTTTDSKISNHGFDHGTGEMKLFMAGKIE